MSFRALLLLPALVVAGCTFIAIPGPPLAFPGAYSDVYEVIPKSWHPKVDDCNEGDLGWLGQDEHIGADYCLDPDPNDGLSHCGRVELYASPSAYQGGNVLRVSANDAGVNAATPNNHVIAYRRVADTFVTGWWRYRFAARIPPMRPDPMPVPPPAKGTFTGLGQTGPEFSLQNSRFEVFSILGPDIGEVRLISYICGLQYIATPYDPPGAEEPAEGEWNIWVRDGLSERAYWQRLPRDLLYLKLARDKWYHFEFTVNFTTMRYGRFVIREGSATGPILKTVDLSGYAVFGEWKWKDPPLLQKFEMSLEVEDYYNAPANPSVEQYEVHYDCAQLDRWERDWIVATPWPPVHEYEWIDWRWYRYQRVPIDWPRGPWPGPWPNPDPLPYERR